jgi:hypothetical protein
MGNFVIRDYKFIYAGDSEEVLLDLSDPFSNKGRIPFNSALTEITIPNLISLNMENHERYCGANTRLVRYEPYFVIMDLLLIREHIKSKYPKTIVEYGCNDVLSLHYLAILKNLHPQTKYLINKCDNNGISEEVDADMVFVNGTDIIRNCDQMIASLHNYLNRGVFICAFVIGQEKLCDNLREVLGKGKEYRLNDTALIMLW